MTGNHKAVSERPADQMSARADICDESLDNKGLRALCAEFLVDPDASQEALFRDAAHDLNEAMNRALRAGCTLLAAKARCEHGQFDSMLATANIHRQRANEVMRLSAMYAGLPDKDRRLLLAAPKSKAVKLASLDEDAVDEIARAGHLDELLALPNLQLAKAVRNLRQRCGRLEINLQTTELKLQAVRQQPLGYDSAVNAPMWVRTCRHESAALTEQVDLCLDSLEKVAHDCLFDLARLPTRDKGFEEWRAIAAGTLFHRLQAQQLRAQQLLSRLHEEFGSAVTGQAKAIHALSKDEMLELHSAFRGMADDHAIHALARKVSRDNAIPGKRGRKKKAPEARTSRGG